MVLKSILYLDDSIDDASFDYNPESKNKSEYLLQDVNFGVDLKTRIGILGRSHHQDSDKDFLLFVFSLYLMIIFRKSKFRN